MSVMLLVNVAIVLIALVYLVITAPKSMRS